jgi:hypothetical protein
MRGSGLRVMFLSTGWEAAFKPMRNRFCEVRKLPRRHGISAGGDNMSRALAIVAGACPLSAAKARSRDSSEAR